MMKLKNKTELKKRKKSTSPSEPCKPGLNFQTHKPLNSRPGLNLKAQHLKI
jgi:hypothetical protein